jgi:hypothetical protein
MCVYSIGANSQVTIGSLDEPERGAILDLKSSTMGFLPPRVPLEKINLPNPLPTHVEGMVVYNLTVNKSETLKNGLYYNTGAKWVRLSTPPPFLEGWFYMPSVVFDTSVNKTGATKDLYQEYINQFDSPKVKNLNAPAFSLPNATDLDYYILDYDISVFNNVSVNDTGLMTYDIIGTATDETFINIVFVEK